MEKKRLGRAGISAHQLIMDRDLKVALSEDDSDATEMGCQQKLNDYIKCNVILLHLFGSLSSKSL